jgi:chromate transporter
VTSERSDVPVPLRTIAREWGRLGVIGFGGPPTHIALLRTLCVQERQWIDAEEFQDTIATVNLLPGPASTQLAIYCAWRLRGTLGALVGGFCFIAPGFVLITALAALFLEKHPPLWILGAAAGAGAAVPAVALYAASRLATPRAEFLKKPRPEQSRKLLYGVAGAACAATLGAFVVVALLACGVIEIVVRAPRGQASHSSRAFIALAAAHAAGIAGLGALAWVALKVGALSYGGGFVIIPLMQHDVVRTYHWMTGAQFLNAVALGQVTPGPVVLTVAVVGYAVRGVAGAALATLVAFTPSFLFVLFGARHFARVRSNQSVLSFLAGTGPAVIGAICGSAIPLGLELHQWWQVAVLAGALTWLLLLRRGIVSALLLAGAIGVVLALVGAAV